jgi:SAM-dependent methyltransferase
LRVLPESQSDNPLREYFNSNSGHTIHKWHHYFDIYHNHFRRYRNTPVRILEIGVNKGGSLQMWKSYFGAEAQIFGVDISPRCKLLEEEQIEIFIGDQADRGFLRGLRDKLQNVDILIDDGGHEMEQQITTFEELYQLVNENGVYLVEDLHTSYMSNWNGGLGKPKTFIMRAKRLIDELNAWHHSGASDSPNAIHKTATGIHFYTSVLVLEKCPCSVKLRATKTGTDPFKTMAT